MEQNTNTAHKVFFSTVVANPLIVGTAHLEQIKALVDLYPQSGMLRSLLARATQTHDQNEFQHKLKSAAVYAPDRSILYNLINYPEKLYKTSPYSNGVSVYTEPEEVVVVIEEIKEEYNDEEVAAGYPDEQEQEHVPVETAEEPEAVIEAQPELVVAETITILPEEPVVELAAPLEPGTHYLEPEEEIATDFNALPAKTHQEENVAAQYAYPEDEDDVTPINYFHDPEAGEQYYQPGEDIFYQPDGLPDTEPRVEDTIFKPDVEPVAPANLQFTQPVETKESAPVEEFKKEEYTFSGNNFKSKMSAAADEDEMEYEVVDEPGSNATVSKYDDDKLPYSFMWWLDKTRKEHASTHQPYIAPKPVVQELTPPPVSEELQQQYYENLFHLTTIEDLDKNSKNESVSIALRKEDQIVERFIQQDPQLKPPSLDTPDKENKAKKSSEDTNEMVSETLARIYLDQMLYSKAILTYQKLLLKFPEKSSYFVAQIKMLEKKLN